MVKLITWKKFVVWFLNLKNHVFEIYMILLKVQNMIHLSCKTCLIIDKTLVKVLEKYILYNSIIKPILFLQQKLFFTFNKYEL